MADQKLEEKLRLMVPTRLGGHYQTLLHSDYTISCCVGTPLQSDYAIVCCVGTT